MSLRTRILVLILAPFLASLAPSTWVLLSTAEQAVLRQTELDGQVIAAMLGRAVDFAAAVPRQMEEALGREMVVNARLAAELVAVAEAAKLPPAEINKRLAAVVAEGGVDEIWVTDETGRAYLHSRPGVEFTFSPDPAKQPQAHEFTALLR
ncbi:MAG: PP2C family protein-serine/threonine phosphatase, partial [Planctomycetia bacterium]